MALLTNLSAALRNSIATLFPKPAGREFAQIIDDAKAITDADATHVPGYFTTVAATTSVDTPLIGAAPATAGSYLLAIAGDETGADAMNNYGLFVNVNLTNNSGENTLHAGIVPEATTTTGTVTIVASLYVAEPIITVASGSVILACTMYIASAPTEGAVNYALYVATGKSHVQGVLSLGDSGTGTASGTGGTSTVTLSKQRGIITTDAITTAAGATHVITVTNTLVAATSNILVTLDKNASAGRPIITSVTPGSGSFTVEITNIHASAAVDAALKVHFLVLNAT